MTQIQTDYLVIGAGAVGLAFADTLLQETDAHITIVDKHGKPGGHWNDAYPFVALHQPSAFYGVNAMPLGDNRKDVIGVNKGFYELASGPEVSGYFNKVMQQILLPSGRVRYFPMSNYLGGQSLADHRFVSLLSGDETHVTVRNKLVDATYYRTSVPSTHTPKFSVAPGVRLVTPNALAQLWQGNEALPLHYVIVGAGKTAMDVGVWLLNSGAPADAISWVMPRDSWLLNRRYTQPGAEFFSDVMGAQADQMQALADAQTADDLFLRLEASGQVLRIDPQHTPSMFHYATLSEGEVALLRQIKHVIRMGRVKALEPTRILLEQGEVPVAPHTLFIDCSASAVEKLPVQPIFQADKLVLQMVRIPQPAFSAALVAFVEAHCGRTSDSNERKNQLCTPVPLPRVLQEFPRATLVAMMNQLRWGQDKALRQWIRTSRLDGFGKLIAEIDPADAEKLAVMGRYKASAQAAMGSMARWMEQAD